MHQHHIIDESKAQTVIKYMYAMRPSIGLHYYLSILFSSFHQQITSQAFVISLPRKARSPTRVVATMFNSTSTAGRKDGEQEIKIITPSTLASVMESVSNKVAESTQKSASDTLDHFLVNSDTGNTSCILVECIEKSTRAAKKICSVANDPTLQQKQRWQTLQTTVGLLLEKSSESSALAVSMVFSALALMTGDDVKASASAISNTVSRNKEFKEVGRGVACTVLELLMDAASRDESFSLNTITYFAKAFQLTGEEEPRLADLAARAIQFNLAAETNGENAEGQNEEAKKQRVGGALALSCQIYPWHVLPPVLLVEAAIPFDFWHAAEQVCVSANKVATKSHRKDFADVFEATEALIDMSMEHRTYRRADTLATNLYEAGGKSRYVDARFYHSCDTIAKVISRRQFPIIERQVERVDRAVAKVEGSPEDYKEEIRSFTLRKLEEVGEIDAAHRFATLWGWDYSVDEQSILEAAEARRKKYLQLSDVCPGVLPDLISEPEKLRKEFEAMRHIPYKDGPYGLDAEWDDDTKGVAVLQLGSVKKLLLIDIPALSSTREGVDALEETVGALFACPKSIVVGFACRQDLSRLRVSHCQRDTHWLTSTQAVVDVQTLVAKDEPQLSKIGLSRVCEHYFGKPLDKAEQCSQWSGRPLTENQRAYAAMDAWACAAIFQKL